MFKRILGHKTVQITLAFILAQYMRLVRATTRWTIEGQEYLQPLQGTGAGFIACAWHSRFLMTPAGWSKMPQTPHVLISKSRDGNIVAYTSKFLKLGVVRGSRRAKYKDKNKRGAGALREMINVLEKGDCIFMTPDGPKGPRMRMGEGPLRLAKLSGAPLLVYGLSVSRKKLFNSWDRFMLPYPFGRGMIIFDKPLYVDEHANEYEIETLRQEFENRLNQATQACDRAMGMDPVLPEPEKASS
ncbi:MAG TPA: DUF374 domain-containing protein [Hellea balneolensis]|uniref:DUF374 domain-containing protein n=1 Tax=Hellea balneolensis TaxID=287478 RepID=A0A7C5LTM7_9PROT|nr:DUF374 domain-containing protein [Hellea balneolensis]